MTKAELLQRLRWLFLILPAATAAGFRLLLFLSGHMESAAFPSMVASALGPLFATVTGATALFFAAPGWLLLTLACSARTARTVADDGQICGLRGFAFVLLTTPLVFGLHAGACIVVFGIFPFN